jgi:hypothetical protein
VVPGAGIRLATYPGPARTMNRSEMPERCHPGCVELHQDGSVERSGRRIDQPRDFLRTEDPGQPDSFLWVRGLAATWSTVQT